MPSGANHPSLATMKCPFCREYPEKWKSKRGYEYFSCGCGESNSGWTIADAVAIWNYLVEERTGDLLYEIAKKLNIIPEEPTHGPS